MEIHGEHWESMVKQLKSKTCLSSQMAILKDFVEGIASG